MRKGLLSIAAVVLALTGQLLVPAAAQTAQPSALAEHRKGVVLVGFVPGASADARASALNSVGARSSEQLSPLASDARIVRLGSMSVTQAIAVLSRNPNVRYAEPDYIVHGFPTATPDANDPGYNGGISISGTTYKTWGLFGSGTAPNTNSFGSGAGELWAPPISATGSNSIIVGDIDTGIQITHPDLSANIWTNPEETAGNGIDDDGNGYIDDINGWDFLNNNASVYDSSSIDTHGTHTAGTIGAKGNNSRGVPGVNWNVTIVPAKFLGSNGGYISDAVKAVDYLTDLKTRQKVDVVATNNSWGGGGFTQSLLDAIRRGGDEGILFIAAAGNSTRNNDSSPSYPASYDCSRTAAGVARDWDCVIAVAAIDSAGARASFTNYGATSVDLGAPGVGVLSTYPNTLGYAVLNGTSMATPHVTGAVALCASMGSLRGGGLWAAVLRAAQDTPTASMNGFTSTGGRLNLPAMARVCSGADPLVRPTFPLSVALNRLTQDGVTASGTVGVSAGEVSVLSCASPPCSSSLSGPVTLTAYPSATSAFTGWSGACSGTSTCTLTMTQGRSVTANFRPLTYGVSLGVSKPSRTSPYVTVSTVNGTAWSAKCSGTCSKTVVTTTTLRFVATTVSGATRYTWGGACSGVTTTTCTVTVSGTTTVSIQFRASA